MDSIDNTAQVSAVGEGNPRVIYVVDDQAALLEFTTMLLEMMGCRVEAFIDPREALRAYEGANPRPVLVITDFAMPGMNGFALMDECRKIRPDQKFMLLSGSARPEVRLQHPTQPDAYLAKPYDSSQFHEVVKSLIA